MENNTKPISRGNKCTGERETSFTNLCRMIELEVGFALFGQFASYYQPIFGSFGFDTDMVACSPSFADLHRMYEGHL